MSTESPRPEIQVLEKAGFDPEQIARDLLRRRAEQVPADLRYSIERSVALRCGAMEPIKGARL